MPKFACFDSAKPAPSPVVGWYDTDAVSYPNLPAEADLLGLTADQWAARLANLNGWAVSDGTLIPYAPPVPAPNR